jgi:hypothetical protein
MVWFLTLFCMIVKISKAPRAKTSPFRGPAVELRANSFTLLWAHDSNTIDIRHRHDSIDSHSV